MIRLIAIDLDGTLLDDDKRVSDQTADGLRCAARRGIKVVIASARPPRSVRHIYQHLGLDTLQINYNGALIWDPPACRPVRHLPMAQSLVRAAVDIARSRFDHVSVSCEVDDRWLTDRHDQPYQTETARLFPPDRVAPLDHLIDGPMTKLMFLADEPTITDLLPVLSAHFNDRLAFIRAEPNLLQIINPAAGKGTALAWVADHYQIPAADLLAIGDADNDVGMLTYAGTAVAMSNGSPAVKSIADWVAPRNTDHGVHAALIHYGLCD